MLPARLAPLARQICSSNVGAAISSQSVRLASYGSGHFKQPTMDDLPVPQGCWKENHARLQRKYNLHLLLGVGFTIVSLVVAKQSGLFYLNFYPPDRPADK